MSMKFLRAGGALATAIAASLVTTGLANSMTVAKPAVAATVVAPVARTPADIARGKALFTGTCGAYCHRPSGGGSAAVSDAPSLFDCDWKHGGSDAQIFHTIKTGVNGTRMVSFDGAIEDEDIWRIIAYLHSASQCKAAH